MKERPILFNGEMVRAVIEGRKTQTRRVLKQPKCLKTYSGPMKKRCIEEFNSDPQSFVVCPYGNIGDKLWVRETWAIDDCGRRVSLNPDAWPQGWPLERLRYPATDDAPYETETNKKYWWNTRPSIHMPRWASRITLEITGVRVERLQDISEEDAMNEGVHFEEDSKFYDHKTGFMKLWESINGEGSWDSNPWVWVIEFRRIEDELF